MPDPRFDLPHGPARGAVPDPAPGPALDPALDHALDRSLGLGPAPGFGPDLAPDLVPDLVSEFAAGGEHDLPSELEPPLEHGLEQDVRPGGFWARLTPADRQALRAMGRRTAIPPRGMLCHQGVAAPAVYVVFKEAPRAEGNAIAKEFVDSSDGDQSIIDLFGAGDLVGVLGPWGHPQRGTACRARPHRGISGRAPQVPQRL